MTPFDDPEARITRVGKEVLLDGRHFADGETEAAAECIALAVHYFGIAGHRVPAEHMAAIEAVLA